MLIALPIDQPNTEAFISKKCSRSPYFALIDKEQQSILYIENPHCNETTNVAEQVISFLINKHQISGLAAYEMGIKATQVAKQKKIQLIIIDPTIKSLNKLLHYMKIQL